MDDLKNVQWVFVCGCARSGTSALADLLRSHGRFAIGRERYGRLFNNQARLTPELFQKERFCSTLVEGDCHHKKLDTYYEDLLTRFDRCKYRGDKIPGLYREYPQISRDFPGCRILFMLRNVFDVAYSFEIRRARSQLEPNRGWPTSRGYMAAVAEWNLAIRRTLEAYSSIEIMIVPYEQLYVDKALLDQIFSFLRADPEDSVLAFWSQAQAVRERLEADRANRLTSLQKEYIMRHAAFSSYQSLVALSDRSP